MTYLGKSSLLSQSSAVEKEKLVKSVNADERPGTWGVLFYLGSLNKTPNAKL